MDYIVDQTYVCGVQFEKLCPAVKGKFDILCRFYDDMSKMINKATTTNMQMGKENRCAKTRVSERFQNFDLCLTFFCTGGEHKPKLR